MSGNGSASIEVVADLIRKVVDIRIEELDPISLEPLSEEDGPQVELSVGPELARELAFRLSLAAIKIEEHDN